MINSPQHKLAKWINQLLAPVLEKYSRFTIKDSFTFVNEVRNFKFNINNTFWCSYDVKSLFTCVPLEETIDICCETLFPNSDSVYSGMSRSTFCELIRLATSSVEFSFNGNMFRQIDGISMGSPLGPSLANIFLGYYENKILHRADGLLYYCRYVDDTFAVFKKESQCDTFLNVLNNLHPALEFTYEKESNNTINFLDVSIQREDNNIITDIYRKPTFTGEAMKWSSFSPSSSKTKLISTLVDRAMKICSPSRLNSEILRLKTLFRQNGYPDEVVEKTIMRKLLKKPDDDELTDNNFRHVYLRLPYIGQTSHRYGKIMSRAISETYDSVRLKCIFQTRKVPVKSSKDVLPTLCKSNVIYLFVCQCEKAYVGRTTQSLKTRVDQHVPIGLRSKISNNLPLPKTAPSSIAQHLLENKACALKFSTNCFSILAYARNDFHLSILEAIFISTLNPDLCKQKKFVLPLRIFR